MNRRDPRSPRGFRDASDPSEPVRPSGERGFAPANPSPSNEAFADQDGALFSAQELAQLVRAEVDGAERQGYSLACMRLAVDRLDSLQDIYGREARSEIVQSLMSLLQRDLRGSDFIGHLADGSLLCLLPHATLDGLRGVAGRLLRGARALVFESGRKQVRITLSIGLAHASAGDRDHLAYLRASADEGLARASAGGGDRLLEVDLAAEARLRAEREREQNERVAAAVAPPPQPEPAPAPAMDPQALLGMIREALAEHSGAIAEVQRRRAEPAPAGGGDSRQVDILERRVSKLASELERYQGQLLKIANAEPDEQGVRSLGKLAGREAAMNPAKLEMMGDIFRANLALKDALGQTPTESDSDSNSPD